MDSKLIFNLVMDQNKKPKKKLTNKTMDLNDIDDC